VRPKPDCLVGAEFTTRHKLMTGRAGIVEADAPLADAQVAWTGFGY
jgi:hypothetical protein